MSDLPTYVLERVFDAPRELVWKTWTDPELLPRWYGPRAETIVHRLELKPGGLWLVEMQWGGNSNYQRVEYTEVTPPERLVSTESWGGDWPETLNTLVLTEEDGKTTMTCTVLYPSKEARDAALGTGMKEGWSASYDRLDEYLRLTARPKPRPKRHR